MEKIILKPEVRGQSRGASFCSWTRLQTVLGLVIDIRPAEEIQSITVSKEGIEVAFQKRS